MELHVTAELGAKLAHSAARQGRNPDELAQEVLSRHFEQESLAVEAVKRGEEVTGGMEYLTREQASQQPCLPADEIRYFCRIETISPTFTSRSLIVL